MAQCATRAQRRRARRSHRSGASGGSLRLFRLRLSQIAKLSAYGFLRPSPERAVQFVSSLSCYKHCRIDYIDYTDCTSNRYQHQLRTPLSSFAIHKRGPAMRYARLGNTGVQVSTLSLGTALLGVAPLVS